VLLLPLAVTSTNGMVRRLGPRAWNRLHRLIYVIVPLGATHYFLMVKRDTRPVLYIGALVAVLLAWRLARWAQGRGAAARKTRAKPA
jgi:sulfoxide reductase heme-binding subunit YedZ